MKNRQQPENREEQQFKEIPIKGSLGLLAYGDIGLRAWRNVRDSSLKNQEND